MYKFKKDASRIRQFEEIDKIATENEGKPETQWTPMFDGRLNKYYQKWHIPTSKSLPFDHVLDE